MTFQEIGINLDAVENIEPINLTTPGSAQEFFTQMPIRANEVTNGFFGLGASIGLFIFLVYYLSDISEFGNFSYTKIRGVGISACIVSILGFFALNVGFFNNYYHIVIFVTITMICLIWVYIEEP